MNVNMALQSTFGDNVQALRSRCVCVCDSKFRTIAFQVVCSLKCRIIVCFLCQYQMAYLKKKNY